MFHIIKNFKKNRKSKSFGSLATKLLQKDFPNCTCISFWDHYSHWSFRTSYESLPPLQTSHYCQWLMIPLPQYPRWDQNIFHLALIFFLLAITNKLGGMEETLCQKLKSNSQSLSQLFCIWSCQYIQLHSAISATVLTYLGSWDTGQIKDY